MDAREIAGLKEMFNPSYGTTGILQGPRCPSMGRINHPHTFQTQEKSVRRDIGIYFSAKMGSDSTEFANEGEIGSTGRKLNTLGTFPKMSSPKRNPNHDT